MKWKSRPKAFFTMASSSLFSISCHLLGPADASHRCSGRRGALLGSGSGPLRDRRPRRPPCQGPAGRRQCWTRSALASLGRWGQPAGRCLRQRGLVSPQLQEEAWRGFAALADPLAGLLDMLDGSRGWRGRGPSLEAWVARELKRWLQARPHPGPPQVSPRPVPKPRPSLPCTGPRAPPTEAGRGGALGLPFWAPAQSLLARLASGCCLP